MLFTILAHYPTFIMRHVLGLVRITRGYQLIAEILHRCNNSCVYIYYCHRNIATDAAAAAAATANKIGAILWPKLIMRLVAADS